MAIAVGMQVACWDLDDRYWGNDGLGLGIVRHISGTHTGGDVVVEMMFPEKHKGKRLRFIQEALFPIPITGDFQLQSLGNLSLQRLARLLHFAHLAWHDAATEFNVQLEILPKK